MHFRQSISDPNRLEDDVNRILHSLSGNPLFEKLFFSGKHYITSILSKFDENSGLLTYEIVYRFIALEWKKLLDFQLLMLCDRFEYFLICPATAFWHYAQKCLCFVSCVVWPSGKKRLGTTNLDLLLFHVSTANGKLLGRNRAEVGCFMPPPQNRIHQSPSHVRSHSHDKEAKSLSDQRVPVSIPTPDSSPGTSPLRFTR